MKKIFLGITAVALSATIGAGLGIYNNKSIQNSDDRIYSQAICESVELDTVLNDSDLIVSGEVTDIIKHPDYDEYTLSVSKIEKGTAPDSIKVKNYLYEYDADGISDKTITDYQKGNEYIFILQHISNVYEDSYLIMNNAYIPVEDSDNCHILCENLGKDTDIKKYIENYDYKDNIGKGAEFSIDYIEDNSFENVWSDSQYIAKIKVLSLSRHAENADVYICELKKNIKGNITTDENNQIIIPFFKNTVAQGDEYVVCLNSEDDNSIIYTLSSKNSIY